jgi:hypothetical protein
LREKKAASLYLTEIGQIKVILERCSIFSQTVAEPQKNVCGFAAGYRAR